jgi:putative SOS response-associated peptidase YedK
VTNEYHLRATRSVCAEPFARRQVPLAWTGPESGRAPDEPFRPTDLAPMIRPLDPADLRAGLQGALRRWWLVPAFHRGPVAAWKSLCANAPVETLDTSPIFRDAYARRRALIPLTSFIVHDQPPGWRKGQPKRRWEVTWIPKDEADRVRFFAGIWERATPSDLAEPLESFAFVTGSPGPDLAAIQDRQPAVLTLAEGLAWLDLDGPGKAGLVTETPAGTYRLTEAPRDAVMSREMRRAL